MTGHREFCDDNEYFRFTLPEERLKPDLQVTAQTDKEDKAKSTFLSPCNITPEELYEFAQWFLAGVTVKENKFRAKSYRQTFVGSEAVSYLVNNSRAISRKEAVELGRKLSVGFSLFRGIDGSREFKDDYLLYRFEEQWKNESFTNLRTSTRAGMVSGLGTISGISAKSLPLEKVAEAFRANMVVKDHRRLGKTFKETFVGRQGVDFFVGHGLTQDRVAAVDLGRALAREFELFKHVRKEHEFKDGKHLYRFCYDGEIRPLEVIELDKVKLTQIARGFVENVKVSEHRKHLLVFKDTFVGSEAVGM